MVFISTRIVFSGDKMDKIRNKDLKGLPNLEILDMGFDTMGNITHLRGTWKRH